MKTYLATVANEYDEEFTLKTRASSAKEARKKIAEGDCEAVEKWAEGEAYFEILSLKGLTQFNEQSNSNKTL